LVKQQDFGARSAPGAPALLPIAQPPSSIPFTQRKVLMTIPAFTPVMSNGLGVESVAILLRWLLEPDTRDFPLEQLVVITAMVGAEWPDTGEDFEKHMLPLFRQQEVRFVQVARGGHLEQDGITILDDSRHPEHLHIGGAYTLTEELETAGTVPQYGAEHRCSLKFKAFVIETWLDEFLSGSIRQTFGFNADEQDRVKKSDSAIAARMSFGFNADEQDRINRGRLYDTPFRMSHYPLVVWGWNRQQCLTYIQDKLGILWRKSACRYCPFARITPDLVARQKQFPVDTANAMFTERLSLAMNERGQLYSSGPLYQIVVNSGNDQAVSHFNLLLKQQNWAVYRVRRIYKAKAINEQLGGRKRIRGYDSSKKGTAERCVEQVAVYPTEIEATQGLRDLALQYSREPYHAHGLWYAKLSERAATYPTFEEFFVAAPARVETKARYGVEAFDQKWAEMSDLYCGRSDLPLLASLESPE
jgi:hypothetical protein